jgi:hypothetical protein
VLNIIWSGRPPDFRVRFGVTPPGTSGVTIGHIVTLGSEWSGLPAVEQIFLLGHEPTHTAQWERLGALNFISRYVSEYPKYGVPSGLAAVPLGALDVTDSWWSLDQLADRMGREAVNAARAEGMLP